MFKKVLFRIITVALVAVFIFANGSAALAQEGQKFIVSVDNIANFKHKDSGVFNTPLGSAGPGPALPGSGYAISLYGDPGDYINFATMQVQSNDWFFGPDEFGIPLYNADGTPRSGDVTHYVKLWDSGTEGDEPLGQGANQAPRQAGPNSGPADPNTNVRQVLRADLPVNQLVRVTLTPNGGSKFTLTINNISSGSVASPLAPGVAVVHNTPAPFFINGAPDWGRGLEALAEDGNAGILGSYIAAQTGVNTPIAPVAWTVHQGSNVLFASGTRASAGLEALAEDGGPVALVGEINQANKGAQPIARGASGPGPAFAPAGNYSFEITANAGDNLSLATMFVHSNDWFFGLNGLPLFDADGNPRNGGVTHLVRVYDAGTEVDQEPGFGSNQAPRQSGPNTGPSQGSTIHDTGRNAANYIHVTITPVN
ncbi:MAG: spondin domain-containing protein [Chloroflexota bacterium]